MLLRAAKLLPIDLTQSWIIGDRARDIAAGRNAGLAGGLLAPTDFGHQDEETQTALALGENNGFRVFVDPTITAALTLFPLFGRTRRE
jgi:D-glycero-D-manno-heptose 1,7-bisphosphate phosphatase